MHQPGQQCIFRSSHLAALKPYQGFFQLSVCVVVYKFCVLIQVTFVEGRSLVGLLMTSKLYMKCRYIAIYETSIINLLGTTVDEDEDHFTILSPQTLNQASIFNCPSCCHKRKVVVQKRKALSLRDGLHLILLTNSF